MSKTIIIAEAGVNHNGDLHIAKQLIDEAAMAKVDFIKFQSFSSDKLVSNKALKADYQKANTNSKESQLEMLRKLELSRADHFELLDYCKLKEIQFLSTAFDLESIDLLVELGVKLGKIPSGEITNYPYLVKMAKNFSKIILSTGMSDLNEIISAINVLLNNGRDLSDITVLHCNTEYPTPMKDVNLLAMSFLRNKLGVEVGYSDHTIGIEVPIAAVALGAVVIEKHFTLSKEMQGPDHRASIEPSQLKLMVQSIRNIEEALGSKEKIVTESETKNKIVARKSIVAKMNISKGEVFTENNITTKRPGNGISPMHWEAVLGKLAKRNFEIDDLIEL